MQTIECLVDSRTKIELKEDVCLARGGHPDPIIFLPAGTQALVLGKNFDLCYLADGSLEVGIKVSIPEISEEPIVVPVNALKLIA